MLPSDIIKIIFPPITSSFVCKYYYKILTEKRNILIKEYRELISSPIKINFDIPVYEYITKINNDKYEIRTRDYAGICSYICENNIIIKILVMNQ